MKPGSIGIVAAVVGFAILGTVSQGVQGAGPTAPSAAADASSASAQQALVNRYCVTCHNERNKARAGNFALEGIDIAHPSDNPVAWERVVVKLQAGAMPPLGMPRPDKATYEGLRLWLETELDKGAATHPNPGRTEAFHRLNRVEYRNAVRDLLGLELDVNDLLPADESSYGFDNVAGILRVNPTLMEKYLSVAKKVTRIALGTVSFKADTFRVPDDLQQQLYVDGLPLGTRGGIRVDYFFPVDGEYLLKVRLAHDMEDYIAPFEVPQQLELGMDGLRLQLFTIEPGRPPSIDRRRFLRPADKMTAEQRKRREDVRRIGISNVEEENPVSEKIARKELDANWEIRIPVKAGQHTVTAAFLPDSFMLDEDVREPFQRPYKGGYGQLRDTRMGAFLENLQISGPFEAAGSAESGPRQKLFVCRPATPTEEPGCARSILEPVTRRAYRRPVTETDLEPILSAYRKGQQTGGFQGGIELALQRVLISPEFLFRVERDRPAQQADAGANNAATIYPLSDLELASRLSFFLWSSVPDDELINVAAKGTLHKPEVLERQVRRMLVDPRSAALVENFAGQWLMLRNVNSIAPNLKQYPDFGEDLRLAFRKETELFFESVMREDRSLLEFLNANYTFVNEQLADFYGIPNVRGPQFQRVTLSDDSPRRGLLGKGALLGVTSHADRTSPVKRGKWILENLLGTPPPEPPPNVPALMTTATPSGAVLTLRQRMEQHRANAVCASCHSQMDPLGFALENFDAVGKYRTVDEGFNPIDASGLFLDGTKITGPDGLRQALLARSDRFVATVIEKLMIYALGRGMEPTDAPAIRAIRRDVVNNEYRFSSVLLGIVKSLPFQMRKADES